MEKLRELVWLLLIGVLVVFFGGWILGSILNLVTLESPPMVSKMFCPEGSTARRVSAVDQPGRNGSITCRDQDGVSVPALSDEESIVMQRKYIYRPSYIIMIVLVVGWLLWRLIFRRKRDESNE